MIKRDKKIEDFGHFLLFCFNDFLSFFKKCRKEREWTQKKAGARD